MFNFIHFKYRPKTLDNFTILSDITNKLSCLSKHKYLNNLIIYGKMVPAKKHYYYVF